MKKTYSILMLVTACLLNLSTVSVQADDAQDKAKAMLQGLGLGGQQEAVEVIGWRELAKLLPKEVEGMEAGKLDGGTYKFGGPTGESDTVTQALSMLGGGTNYSSVERRFIKKIEGKTEARLTFRIIDAGVVRAMLAPFLTTMEYDRTDGLLKNVEINGHKGKLMQKFNDDMDVTETQYMVLIGDRVMVQIDANAGVDPAVVESEAEKFPYDELQAQVNNTDAEAVESN